MSSLWESVCDAWLTDLQTNVTGLDTTTVPADRTHQYAPWSVEAFYAEAGERHLAIWPEGEAEETAPFLTDGGLMSNQSYVIAVWEAADEQTRLQDDDTLNKAWLTLHEGIRARLMTLANIRLGSSTIKRTMYVGSSFETGNANRVMALRFRVEVPLPAL